MICTKILSHPVELTDAQKELAAALGVPPLVMAVLAGRKLTDPGAIRTFLEGKPDPFSDPFLLSAVEKRSRFTAIMMSMEPRGVHCSIFSCPASGRRYRFIFPAGTAKDMA